MTLRGAGRGTTTLQLASGEDAHVISIDNVTDFAVMDLTINGDSENQTANAHGIRVEESSEITVQNVEVTDVRGYGIGLQAGTLKNITLRNLYIHNVGQDGIDLKNTDNANEAITIDNVTVENFDTQGDGTKAGIDIRGPANISNVVILDLPTGGVGIRFRQDDESNGDGGHQSNLTNFRVIGDGAAPSTIGLHIVANNVKVSNGYCAGLSIGARVTDDGNVLQSVHVVDALGDGINVNTASGTLLGDNTSVIGCTVEGSGDDGIFLDGVDNAILIGNRLIDNTGAGVRVGSGCTNTLIMGNHFSGNAVPIEDAGTGTQARNNIGLLEESATGTVTLSEHSEIVKIDSSEGAVTATLGSGPRIGFVKTIVMTDATNSSTVIVTNHETSDPEVITFSSVDDTAVLMWTGTEWITIKLSGATV